MFRFGLLYDCECRVLHLKFAVPSLIHAGRESQQFAFHELSLLKLLKTPACNEHPKKRSVHLKSKSLPLDKLLSPKECVAVVHRWFFGNLFGQALLHALTLMLLLLFHGPVRRECQAAPYRGIFLPQQHQRSVKILSERNASLEWTWILQDCDGRLRKVPALQQKSFRQSVLIVEQCFLRSSIFQRHLLQWAWEFAQLERKM